MKRIRCKKCGAEMKVKFFNNGKFTCENCYTIADFDDNRLYKILRYVISPVALAIMIIIDEIFTYHIIDESFIIRTVLRFGLFAILISIVVEIMNYLGVFLHNRAKK